MRHSVFVSALLIAAVPAGSLVVANPIAAHPPAVVGEAGQRRIAEEIADFRKRMAAAIRAERGPEVRTMYAPSFRHTPPFGEPPSRDAHIAAALAGEAVLEATDGHQFAIHVPNDWVAIATGIGRLQSGRDRGTMRTVRWTAVYTRAGDSWQLAATHVSTVLDPRRDRR